MVAKRKFRRSSRKLPGESDIENGIYLDFEGFGRSEYGASCPPSLCGYKLGATGPVVQVVFSEALKWPARESGLPIVNRAAFLNEFVNVSCSGRKLFAYSEHERDVIRRSGGPRVSKRYRNVRKFAKRYIPRQQRDSMELNAVCARAGIEIPANYGKGEVTGWLREVKQHASSRAKWVAAPAEARQAWALLLGHNRFDVEVLPRLMRQILEQT